MASRCSTLVAAALLLLVLAGCGTPLPQPQARPVGELSVICEPADAMVLVDDRYLGSASGVRERPLRLTAGLHRIELRRDGYFAHYAEVKVSRGSTKRLAVKLRKEPF